jgi:hypothetical protein
MSTDFLFLMEIMNVDSQESGENSHNDGFQVKLTGFLQANAQAY